MDQVPCEPVTAGLSDRKGANGVDRALDVLSLFVQTETSTLGLTEISETLTLSKAVVHRLLSAFRRQGYVEFDPERRRYRLGPEVLNLGLAYLSRMDIRTLGGETLRDLAAATNETATMSVRLRWSRVYVDQRTPQRDIKMIVQLGKLFPLHAGASSKALLAFLAEDEREDYLRSCHLTALTPRTVVDPGRLRSELAEIRTRGYAVSFGERDPSAASVAAPVFGSGNDPAGVISVAGPVERFSTKVEQSSRLLQKAARQLSVLLADRERSGGATLLVSPRRARLLSRGEHLARQAACRREFPYSQACVPRS